MPSNPSLADRGSLPRRSLVATMLAGLLVAALATSLVATPVAAHAYLSESDPENGDQLETLPDEVTLYFSGDGVVNAEITVEGPDGENVAGDPEIDPDDTQIVRVPIGDADGEDGMYAVDWEILADDGHTTAGSFFFAVGDEPLDRDAVIEAHEADETDESISPLEAGSKGLLLVGIVGLIGIPAMAAVAAGPVFARADGAQRATLERHVTRLLAGVALLALTSALVLGLARSTSIGSLSVDALVQFAETPLGQAWLAQLALGVLIVGLVAAMTRGLDRFPLLIGVFVGGLALAGTVAWTSHSATAIDRLHGTVVDFVHIVGAGLWAGGLAVLALAVAPAVRGALPDERAALVAGTIRRYSILALAGVTLVLATGFVLASWHVPTADGLAETTYGLTLVAKLVLIAVALGLGGVTRYVLLGRLEPSRSVESTGASRPTSTDGGTGGGEGHSRTVGRTVCLELFVLLVVLLLSGALTSAPTAAVAGADDGPVESTIEFEYDGGVLEVTAIPTVGERDDRFVLEADEPVVFEAAFVADGDPVDSEQPVRLLTSGDDGTEREVELEETGDGSYATVQPLSAEGNWDLRVTGAPDGAYVSEWIDAVVVPADDHADYAGSTGHDHDEQDHGDHEHGDREHDHGDHGGDDSWFVVVLQFCAVAAATVGSVGTIFEAVRLRDRER